MISDIATRCTDDILTKIKDTREFGKPGKEKAFFVYSEDDLMDKSKMLKLPCVGVMYEGIRSNGKETSGMGMAADCYVAIALLLSNGAVGGVDQKNEAARILDEVRDAIKTSKAPSQHRWKFVSETPAGDIHGAIVYVQRWSCPVILTN